MSWASGSSYAGCCRARPARAAGPAMTDVLGTCTAWGDGVCVVEPDGDGAARTGHHPDRATSSPASRCPPRASTRHRVSPAGGPAPRPGAVARPRDRAAGRLAAAPVRGPRPRAGPTRCWRWARPASTDDYERVVAHYEALGQRPIAAVLPDSAEDALFREPRLGAWRATTTTPSSSSPASPPRAAPSPASRCPAVDVAIVGDDRLVTARGSTDDGRVLASGVAAYADDWVGFRTIEVDPAERGAQARAAGHGRAARVGRRARRDHGVPPGARRQRPARSRSTTGSASSSTTATATWPRPGKDFPAPGLRP